MKKNRRAHRCEKNVMVLERIDGDRRSGIERLETGGGVKGCRRCQRYASRVRYATRHWPVDNNFSLAGPDRYAEKCGGTVRVTYIQ